VGVVQDRFIFEEVYVVSLKKHTHTHIVSKPTHYSLHSESEIVRVRCTGRLGPYTPHAHRQNDFRFYCDTETLPSATRLHSPLSSSDDGSVRTQRHVRTPISVIYRSTFFRTCPLADAVGGRGRKRWNEPGKKKKKKRCGKIWILVCTSKVVVTQWDHVAVIQGISPSRSPTAWPGRSPVFIATKCTVALASSIETASPRKSVSSRSL